MEILYLIAAIAGIGSYIFLKIVRRTTSLLKSALLLLFVISIVVSGFTLDHTKKGHVARAVTSIKQWVKSPVINTNVSMADQFDLPIIEIKKKVLLDVPIISQLPELPRGCEVTSLAMLLKQAGTPVDKLTLAEQVRKDRTPYKTIKDQIHFGNPHVGFVGDMYNKDKPGLGVYHEAIAELAEQYLPGKMKDLTGSDFQELKIHLSDSRPVWAITNTQYTKLSEKEFETWNTPTGKVQITFREHSVVLTGYDSQFIYFNDPLTGEKNKKAPLKDFEESWVQMGRQAITYLPL